MGHRTKVLGAGVVLAFAACSSTGQRTADDYNPGTTPPYEYAKHAQTCDRQAEADQKKFGMGPLDATYSTYNRMFDACMVASGYTRKKPP